MVGYKKLSIRMFVVMYALSMVLQNSLFVDRKGVYAATNPSTTNIVTIFVDKDIYRNILPKLTRYTTQYIQKKIDNSKAVVFPIDTTTIQAHEISQMLENIYFEGIEEEKSKLIGTIFIGNIPLPVVENNGFVYPSIYPYVDFEKQQFVYDTTKKFFVYNNIPNGQAEIRHSILQFSTTAEYNTFFDKVKLYYENPTAFVDKAIRYDDFVGLKKYFIPENSKYYINKLIFSEDIGYRRYNPLLLGILTSEHNQETNAIGDQLVAGLQNTEDVDLQNYANMIQARSDDAEQKMQEIQEANEGNSPSSSSQNNQSPASNQSVQMPTLTLKKSIDEMLKDYNQLMSEKFLVQIKENIAGIARRYTNNGGETFPSIQGTTDKIVQQDNWFLGDGEATESLMIQINSFLEEETNKKIEEEKYYLTVPVSIGHLQFEGDKKKNKCVRPTYNYYHNYYFGQDVGFLKNAGDASIYRGTFQNLQTIQEEPILHAQQGIGSSYKILSTQVEANRGFNIYNAQNELERYNKYKTNKRDLRGLHCPKFLFNREGLNICIKKRIRKPNDSDLENKCTIGNTDEQGGCETMEEFGQRIRGGASPLSLASDMTLVYDYKSARLPIFDIAGSKKISTAQNEANTDAGIKKYAALIQTKLGAGDLQVNNSLDYLIKHPQSQANDLLFTNQFPFGNLKYPTRGPNPPRAYAQVDFFSLYNGMPFRRVVDNKIALYNRIPATDNKGCNVRGDIYTYRTLDSRVKNISPTPDQISDTEIFIFKTGSTTFDFYQKTLGTLQQTQRDVVSTTDVFSGLQASSVSGAIESLFQLKTAIQTTNNGIQNILGFNILQLSSMTAAERSTKANERANVLTTSKLQQMDLYVAAIEKNLDMLLQFVKTVNIQNVLLFIGEITQSQQQKNKRVEILASRKTTIINELNTITTRIQALKAKYIQAKSIYDTLGQIQTISALQVKKYEIQMLHLGNGCSSTYYQNICVALDNLISLGTSIATTNQKITDIASYETTETDENTNNIVVQPFVEITTEFNDNEINIEKLLIISAINTFDVSNNPEKKEIIKGMNITTADRPIDSIRNITFKGVGGDTVKLVYPNIYEVEVYTSSGNKLFLKNVSEIQQAIKTYLTNKAIEYNAILQEQQNKKQTYYASASAQFSLLAQLDPLATPNRTYNLIPNDYFIKKTIEYLDALQNEFGTSYIYGNVAPINDEQKLAMLAKFLYKQNFVVPEKMKKETVPEAINEIKDSFDINNKIQRTIKNYLTENNYQGEFITPTYNKKGYEVAYIHSDGKDYVSAKEIPSFIKEIQNIQQNAPAPSKKNAYVESAQGNVASNIQSCEGVDVNGTALLFDFKTFSSPWLKAMKCRIQQTLEKPFGIKVIFDQALGPVFLGQFAEMATGAQNFGTQRKEYGSQRTNPDNGAIVNQYTGQTQQRLQGYNTYALVKLNKKVVSVDDPQGIRIDVGMMQDMNLVKIKISGTGDNCFGIQRNGTTISSNICTTTAQEIYNPYADNYVFTTLPNQPKAGSTTLKVELCIPHHDPALSPCITKQHVIHTTPGPIQNIHITTPTSIVMEGAQLPIVINAKDRYDNTITKSIEPYTIKIATGDGIIGDATVRGTDIEFDDFNNKTVIYQAPIGIEDNKAVSIDILPKNEDTPTPIFAQKNISVVKGIITIQQNNTILYKTNTNLFASPKINFTLPNKEDDIQYVDTGGLAQIRPENIPSIRILVKDRNNTALETVVNVSTQQGILIPGTIYTKSFQQNNIPKTQKSFKKGNDFVVQGGQLDISLYPNFKAGEDTITISIPGVDPIHIPIQVYPGKAKKVLMKIENTKMDLTTVTGSTGTIDVVDSRNNKVTTGTIKIGIIGAATSSITQFVYTGKEFSYTINAKNPGGEGYIFAHLYNVPLSEQIPAYERFIVQESILPKEKLNVLYVSLFGTDRGNQRGYFSENKKIVNTITTQSNKLLATTTQLIDHTKIKKMEYIVGKNAYIHKIGDVPYYLTIHNQNLRIQIPEAANIDLGQAQGFVFETSTQENIADINKNRNMLIYIPEATDSVVYSNESTAQKILINNEEVIDLQQGFIHPGLVVQATNQEVGGMNLYELVYNTIKIGTIALRSMTHVSSPSSVDIIDPITYGKITTFTNGSTNTTGIGIYVQGSTFQKQGYESIEDSANIDAGIGFSNNFKNISNFANGKFVGEATVPYGSHFLINFGDPLVERIDRNAQIQNTSFDASIGQTIYSDPNKTIFEVKTIDFNKDGFKDVLIVYTDGTITLAKNYGGTHPYKEPEQLMIIADALKEVHIGDTNGDGYEDIIIVTQSNKGFVYINSKGIFAVDGKNICLNTNTEPGVKTDAPENFSAIRQLFIKDMDKDGIMDIITNDALDDTKIFYGGQTSQGANYISNTTGTCDSQRYQRQQNNYITVKRFGIKINPNRYVQDDSLVHWKNMLPPGEGVSEEIEETGGPNMTNYTESQLIDLNDQMLQEVTNFVGNNNQYIAQGASQLSYLENPLETIPVYESVGTEVYYLPIHENNVSVTVYKQYSDVNGGILKHGDEVVVKTTIVSKTNNNFVTYIDKLNGPRSIKKNKENQISSLRFLHGNTGSIRIDRNVPEQYQFALDNIKLNANESISFSYLLYYQSKNITTIEVDDMDLLSSNKIKDTVPDIGIQNTDPCQKGRRILFNENTGRKRTYETLFENVGELLAGYGSIAQATQQNAIENIMQNIANIQGVDSVLSMTGISDTIEQWSPADIFNRASVQGGNINISTNFIDAATNKVAKKIDEALAGMCQGFTFGKGKEGCKGVPVPFNQAFLAPGSYHLFGCVPKPPNPLYPAFKALNETLGKGLPILAFPTDSVVPVWPPSPLGAGGILQGTTSQFRLYIVPTLTLGLGMAMCFGPYTLGSKIPKPFSDMGGNCIVFALPPLTICPKETTTYAGPATDMQDENMVKGAKIGTCNTPPKTNNTIVFGANNQSVATTTTSAPFQAVASFENTCESCTTNYAPAIPQGNFGGLVQIDQSPITITTTAGDTNVYDGYELKKGEEIKNKVLGAKSKGIVQCVVQDRMTRQISYIQNNLTKMTIQIDMPDVTTIFQGFETIGNLTKTYETLNKHDEAAGYIQTGTTGRKATLSKQNINSMSEKFGQNPFEAFAMMFKEVPLITMNTKDISIKIPALTSDDIIKYQKYLLSRTEKNAYILEERTDMLNKTLALCGTTNKKEAQKRINTLQKAKELIKENTIVALIDAEIVLMQEIVDLPDDQDNSRENMGSDIKNIGLNLSNTITRVQTLPIRTAITTTLTAEKKTNEGAFANQALLDVATNQVKNMGQCARIASGMGDFITFKENTAGLIKTVKENIEVLEQYKSFPLELHQRTHIMDRYLTEISLMVSTFTEDIITWLDDNTNRYAGYVDAIILMVGAIKTRQVLIDFSVNWSEKCSKCSNDNYGSFSCSLSFLCPKLPILPIPPFKIPNIYMDLSHVELGMDITLPKFNFIPINIPLPQLPNIPEPPNVEVTWDAFYKIDIFKGASLPSVPILPAPPTLPELPSFIPIIKMELPVLPPAPKIPKIVPEIGATLKVAEFIGKVFCIVKGGIGLVGEKSIKGKVEQITQRTWNVPIFDYFDLTTKYQDPPLQGFDYKIDAYTQLKFNFDGVYDVFNSIAKATNEIMTEKIENPMKKAIEIGTEQMNNNEIMDKLNEIEKIDQNIDFGMYQDKDLIDYATAYTQLHKGLLELEVATQDQKHLHDEVKKIVTTIGHESHIVPSIGSIATIGKQAKSMVDTTIKQNKITQEKLQNYDTFVQEMKRNTISLIHDATEQVTFTSPIFLADTTTKTILQQQESPTKTYLDINKKMVAGYAEALYNDGPEKLRMTPATYTKAKNYLETTQSHIDDMLLAYAPPVVSRTIAQSQGTTCTTCTTSPNTTPTDMSAYVQGVFVETYSGTEKNMVNVVSSPEHVQKVKDRYVVVDINNDTTNDLVSRDQNSIYIKYGEQNKKHLSAGGNSLSTHYNRFYSYASQNTRNRYISSMDQLRDNSDDYGYTKISNIRIKVVSPHKEVKNFITDGQSFDALELSRKNSQLLGETVDGYLLQIHKKIDDKEEKTSFRSLFTNRRKPQYIVVLPQDTNYENGLVTINKTIVKRPISLELGDSILQVKYYDPAKNTIRIQLNDLPRERLYMRIAGLTITQSDLTANQRARLTLYKKSTPRSNQPVAGMQNIGDASPPVGEIVLRRDAIGEAISTGSTHEGFVNTRYTLKSSRADNVIVSQIIVQKDGQTLFTKNNFAQTGVLNISGLFFTGATEEIFEFIAIDQNNNIAKERAKITIGIPEITVVDVKKTGEETADIVAKISNDVDEGTVTFERIRNNIRQHITGTNQNAYGGFSLVPQQTIITGGIFTMGDEIGLYNTQGNEIATIDPKTGEIKVKQSYQNTIQLHLSFVSHIPVIEIRDILQNKTLFQIVLPIQTIQIEVDQTHLYQKFALGNGGFGAFDGGTCIKNQTNNCVLYTNQAGGIYIPGVYASALMGEYRFDTTNKHVIFVVKDQSNTSIATITTTIQSK